MRNENFKMQNAKLNDKGIKDRLSPVSLLLGHQF
jgi:hypothetical protein